MPDLLSQDEIDSLLRGITDINEDEYENEDEGGLLSQSDIDALLRATGTLVNSKIPPCSPCCYHFFGIIIQNHKNYKLKELTHRQNDKKTTIYEQFHSLFGIDVLKQNNTIIELAYI